MTAVLAVYPLTATETQLDFSGQYDPPLGAVGDAVDALVGHRIAEASVHRFVTEGTIEERIAELLARKRSLADSVLARGETALTELSDAELRDLVELRR